MSHATGRVTLSITGDNSITGLGFQPTWMNIRVSKKNGVTETVIHECLGNADGTNQNCSYIYGDGTNFKTDDFNTKIVSHWEKVSGTWTEVLSATFKQFDTDGFTLTTVAGNTNYKVTFEAGT